MQCYNIHYCVIIFRWLFFFPLRCGEFIAVTNFEHILAKVLSPWDKCISQGIFIIYGRLLQSMKCAVKFMILLHTVLFFSLALLVCILYLRIGPKIFSSSSLAHIILAYLSWPTKVHAHLISFKLKLRIFQSKNDGEKKNTASIWTVSSHWNNKNENKLEYWRFYRWAASRYVYGIKEGRYTDHVLKDTSNFVMTV